MPKSHSTAVNVWHPVTVPSKSRGSTTTVSGSDSSTASLQGQPTTRLRDSLMADELPTLAGYDPATITTGALRWNARIEHLARCPDTTCGYL